jgi:hypothetical protein
MSIRLVGFLLISLGLASAFQATADEEAYLKALEEEAARIGSTETALQPSLPAVSQRERGSREQFERELQKHKGTYSFYKTLLEQDKAEVYKAFLEGADFAQLRKLIIARKLHR